MNLSVLTSSSGESGVPWIVERAGPNGEIEMDDVGVRVDIVHVKGCGGRTREWMWEWEW
jgi:hypothetical protein